MPEATSAGDRTHVSGIGAANFLLFAAVASAAWTPLLVVGGRPLDNYVIALITPAAALLLARRGFPPVVNAMLMGYGLLVIAALLAGYFPTSALASRSAGSSYDALGPVVRFISYAWFCLLAVWVASNNPRVLTAILKVTSTVLVISMWATQMGIVNLPSYADRESTGLRVGGLIGHPNFAAYFLTLALLHIVGREDRFIPKYGLVFLFGSGILLTGSRTAVLGLVVGICYLIVRSFRRSAGTLVAVAVLVALAGSLLIDRFTTFFRSGGLSGSNSSGWRLDQWRRALELQDLGGFTGIGWGRAQEFLPGNLGIHNGYLQVWVELGVLGSVGMLILIYGLVRFASAGDHTSMAIAICLLIANMSDPVLLYPPVTLLALVALSVGWAGSVRHREFEVRE